MRRRLRRLVGLAVSAPGRMELRRRIGRQLWPNVARLARPYRLTVGRHIRVVAVAGSVGKTTTMRAVSAVLGLPVSRPALLNANSHAALGRALLGTPPWRRWAVFETAINGPGQMRRLAAALRPNVAVVTAIGHDHWRSLPTLEATRDEKVAIVRTLPRNGVAILNADDERVRWMAAQTRARVMLVGEALDAHVRATDVELDWPRGMRFTLHVGDQHLPVLVRLMGRHSIFAALAAVAVAVSEGRSASAAVAALESLEPTPGRMQTFELANGAVVVRDEFKGTQDSYLAALAAVAEMPARRRIGVLGPLEESTGNDNHRELARHIAGALDDVIFVGPVSSKYRSAAAAAGLARERFVHAHGVHEAVSMLPADLGPGDVVLIKGRGQQRLGRVGLALAGRNVQCRADPCPFPRMLCDLCPFLEQPFAGLPG